jgi:hypothetical protein
LKKEPPTQEEKERFINFNYPELKDVLKHAVTTMSGVIVLAVGFGDKIILPTSPLFVRLGYGAPLMLFLFGFLLGARALYPNLSELNGGRKGQRSRRL